MSSIATFSLFSPPSVFIATASTAATGAISSNHSGSGSGSGSVISATVFVAVSFTRIILSACLFFRFLKNGAIPGISCIRRRF